MKKLNYNIHRAINFKSFRKHIANDFMWDLWQIQNGKYIFIANDFMWDLWQIQNGKYIFTANDLHTYPANYSNAWDNKPHKTHSHYPTQHI